MFVGEVYKTFTLLLHFFLRLWAFPMKNVACAACVWESGSGLAAQTSGRGTWAYASFGSARYSLRYSLRYSERYSQPHSQRYSQPHCQRYSPSCSRQIFATRCEWKKANIDYPVRLLLLHLRRYRKCLLWPNFSLFQPLAVSTSRHSNCLLFSPLTIQTACRSNFLPFRLPFKVPCTGMEFTIISNIFRLQTLTAWIDM